MLSSLRSFYGWGRVMGHIDVDPSTDLPKVQPGTPRPRPAPELVYREALLRADDRERLILRLAAEVGLRRAEIAQVHSDDLERDLLGWSLVVHGKGQRERVVPIPTALAVQLRERGYGWAFPGSDHGHLSPRWVGKLSTRLLEGKWTLHTLRHRFATQAYNIDRDLFVVQTILGHASPATTRRYVRVDDDRLRATVENIGARS